MITPREGWDSFILSEVLAMLSRMKRQVCILTELSASRERQRQTDHYHTSAVMEVCLGCFGSPEKYLHAARGRGGHMRQHWDCSIVENKRGLNSSPFRGQEGVLAQTVIFIDSPLLGAITKHWFLSVQPPLSKWAKPSQVTPEYPRCSAELPGGAPGPPPL